MTTHKRKAAASMEPLSDFSAVKWSARGNRRFLRSHFSCGKEQLGTLRRTKLKSRSHNVRKGKHAFLKAKGYLSLNS